MFTRVSGLTIRGKAMVKLHGQTQRANTFHFKAILSIISFKAKEPQFIEMDHLTRDSGSKVKGTGKVS